MTCGGPDDAPHAAACDAQIFPGLLEDSLHDLYEHAPCGYLSTLLDGTIAKVNATLEQWLGHSREQLVGHRRFADLLTVGGRIYHETHFAPLLRMEGKISGVALELRTAAGDRLPVLVTSQVKTGNDGQPLLIRTTVFDARERRAYENELLRARQRADRAQEDAEGERARAQQLALTLQASLLPPSLAAVPGLDVAAHYHPADLDTVGGDFYDLFPVDAERWAFFLGDVAGHGPEAAALTSLTRYTLRSATVFKPDPTSVLANLNAVLLQHDPPRPNLCSVIYGLLVPADDGFTVTMASAGHPPPLLVRADARVGYHHIPGGQVLGAFPKPHLATTTLRLTAGDVLLLYTDGLTEARNGDGRYSEGALAEFVAALAPTTATRLIAAITDLLAGFGPELEDDVALVALGTPTGTA